MRGRLDALPGQLGELVDRGTISGAVTLLWQGGEIVHRSETGWRDIALALPMTGDTIFRIASMTKPVTSVAALMLVEEGKLALDDPIARWMPEFAAMRVLRDPEGPLDATEPAARPVTVRDLLTHRSGIAYGFSAAGPIAEAYEAALGDITRVHLKPDAWLARLAALPLLHQPGSRMHYGHSSEVLGYLIERVSGTGFFPFLRTRILDPLGMHDTAFHVPEPERHRLATLYRSQGGALRPVDIGIPAAPPIFCAGGGMLVSTADDYLRFARMLLDHGRLDGIRILRRETVAMMRANQLTPAQRKIPFLGRPYWSGMGFGLGLGIVTDPVRHAWMGPGNPGAFSWPGVWGTWWQADPVLDAVLIYLIQHAAPLGPAARPRPGLDLFQRAVSGAWPG